MASIMEMKMVSPLTGRLDFIGLRDGGGYNLASPQYLADKGYKFLNTNGDWYYVLGRTPETGGGYIEKAIANAAATPFRQLPSTTYPETSFRWSVAW